MDYLNSGAQSNYVYCILQAMNYKPHVVRILELKKKNVIRYPLATYHHPLLIHVHRIDAKMELCEKLGTML